jgi:putative membrane protein
MTERRPQAFRLDDPRVLIDGGVPGAAPPGAVVLTPEPEDAAESPRAAPPRRRLRLGAVLLAAASGLASLWIGLALDRLIRDLFARSEALGWIGLALAALFVGAALALALRELVGILRIARVHTLRADAEAAAASDDRARAGRTVEALAALYAARPETARGRAALAAHLGEIIDGRDLLVLAERELLLPLDAEARRLVLQAAKRVSLVTAISPRALVDLVFVAAVSLRLVRQISTLYGGRPGTLGLLRLVRQVFAHLAVTGGVALTDGMAQQILGHGIAARLSARLGEGLVNGMMTARIGLSALDLCRPLPFLEAPPLRLKDVMAELTASAERTRRQAP